MRFQKNLALSIVMEVSTNYDHFWRKIWKMRKHTLRVYFIIRVLYNYTFISIKIII